MKNYLQQHFGDFILCALISSGLSVNVFAGYEMNDIWSGNLLAVASFTLIVTGVFFLAHFNKRGIRISVLITMATVAAGITALYDTGAFSEARTIDENPALFWVIVAAVSIAVFWMARKRVGIAALFLAGTFMIAAFDLLRYPVSIWGYAIFLIGTFALFIHRLYSISILRSDACKMNYKVGIMQPVLISIIAVAMACGVYYGVVRPIAPPPDQTDLVQKLMSMQVLEKLGVATKTIVYSDQPIESVQNPQNQPKENNPEQKINEEKDKEQKNSSEEGRIGEGSLLIPAMAITYKKIVNRLWIAVPSILILFIFAVIAKLILRKKWYDKLLKMTNEEGAMKLYAYFLRKMRKVGHQRPRELTLLEYALDSQEKLKQFSVYDASFLQLTQIHQKILYGYQRISDREFELFQDFYKEFYRNLRSEMGNLKYCLRFFTI